MNTDNHKGIALCCALCTIIDFWITKRHDDVLGICELQFAFKEGHSTVMCNGTLKEMISHFKEHNSEDYVFLLDASSAFDRVEYGKLFQLLLDRLLPKLTIKLILDGYTRQQIYVQWSGVFIRSNDHHQWS